MSGPNVRVQLRFDLELSAPAALADLDHSRLCKVLSSALGPVIHSLPTISGKQLAKGGITVLAHHHHLDAKSLALPAVDRMQVILAAPHLTDAEIDQVAARVAGRLPAGSDEILAFLRLQALALVNEYRLVACQVSATLSSGKPAVIDGELNLTNGHIFLGEMHRQTRLQAGQGGLPVRIAATDFQLAAECSGHTLTGPVLDVPVGDLVPHRDVLIARWQSR